MRWLRHNWIAVVVLGAVAFNVYDARQVAEDRAEKAAAVVRTAAIKVCVDTSERSALVIAFKERAAQAATDREEQGLDATYRALARGGLLLIPVPAGKNHARQYLTELSSTPDEAATLSTRAKALIRQGCIEDYKVVK